MYEKYEKEERMLRSYFQDAEASKAAVSEDILDAAIQEGIRRGKRAKRSRNRYTLSAILAGAAAAVFLLIWGGSLQLPINQLASEQVVSGPYPPLKGHNLKDDITLNTANRHGMIQPIGKSVTVGDSTITVDGVLVGSEEFEVFYTLENRSNHKVVMQLTELKNVDGSSPEYFASSGSSGGADYDPGTHQIHVNFNFMKELSSDHKDFNIVFRIAPDSANAPNEGEAVGEEKVAVGITLDLDTAKKYIRTVPLHEEIEIEGQKMLLQKIVFSPAHIILKASIDPENTMMVSGLWEANLESVKEGISIKLNNYGSIGPDEDGQITYFFDNNELDQPDSIILRASGMRAVDRAKMKVVVDTEKQTVLSAPDEYLTFKSFTKDKFKNILTLEYEDVNGNYGNVTIEEEFTDGKGNKHKIDDGAYTTYDSTETGGKRETKYISLKPEDYPQPLTFTLSSYPGVIKKSISVPIVAEGKDVKYWGSGTLDSIPKPEGAKEAGIVESNNPNIRMGVKYELKNIGGELGLYEPTEYFQQLKAAGWLEIEEERLGHVQFFEKDGSVAAIEVQEDFIIIYEMKKGWSPG